MLTHPPGSYKPISYEQMYSAVYKWVKKERKPHLLETKNRPSSGVCASSTVKFSTGTSSTTWGVKKKLGIPVRLLESIELIKLTRFTILLPRTRLAQWSSHLSSVQDETFIEEFHKVTISPLIFIIWWKDLFLLLLVPISSRWQYLLFFLVSISSKCLSGISPVLPCPWRHCSNLHLHEQVHIFRDLKISWDG